MSNTTDSPVDRRPPYRILAADDEAGIRMLYDRVLSGAASHFESARPAEETPGSPAAPTETGLVTPQFDLVACERGDHALDQTRRALDEGMPFSVAFLDVRMPPGPDGIWTAREIRRIDPDVHIVIVTGYSDTPPAEIAHQVPPVDKLLYLQKPFDLSEICQLAWALSSKWTHERELRALYGDLELRVEQKTEQLSKALAQAQFASRVKDEFLTNMSHELRTPLNGLLGMIRLLGETRLNGEQRQYVDMAQESGRSLLGLVVDVLDLADLSSQDGGLQEDVFSLSDHVEATMRGLSASARTKGLQWTSRIGPDVPPALVGDARRLGEVLRHLLDNAIKFTDRGGVSVDVGLESRNNSRIVVKITVADTGAGIARDDLDVIFEPFSQVDGSTTRRHEGMGIGLAICRKLVTRMGGRIWAESQPGQGSRFHVTVRLGLSQQGCESPA